LGAMRLSDERRSERRPNPPSLKRRHGVPVALVELSVAGRVKIQI
jgi:hypothetical protein